MGKRSSLQMTTFAIILFHFIQGPVSLYAQEEQSEDIVVGRKAKIHSHIFDEDRTISIHLPGNYAHSDDKYPVVFMLDGESVTSFSHYGSMLNLLGGYHSYCPEMILVGIHNADRARDMTPIKVSWYEDSGKADIFLQFITDELIPYMNENYRTAPYKILFGASAGGNFAIYALLEDPNSFDAYIAASPFFGESYEYMMNKLKTTFKKYNSLDKFLFINYGEFDVLGTIEYTADYISLIKELAPKDFRLSTKFMENEGHVPYLSFYHGIQALFIDWPLKKEQILDYEIEDLSGHFERISKEMRYAVDIPHSMIDELAFRKMILGKHDESAVIFTYYLDQYPQDLFAYLNLAHVYEKLDQKEKAVACYEKILEIDPDAWYVAAKARVALKRLGAKERP